MFKELYSTDDLEFVNFLIVSKICNEFTCNYCGNIPSKLSLRPALDVTID